MSSLCGPGYTLEETIEIMRDVVDTGNCDRMFLETYYYLKKLSEYRGIGTLQECRTAMEYWKYLRERRCGLDAVIEKCMQYEQIGTVEECRKAVEKHKAKVLCDSAEKYADGKCVGYGKSETDDEPCEMCKRCNLYIGYEELESEEE